MTELKLRLDSFRSPHHAQKYFNKPTVPLTHKSAHEWSMDMDTNQTRASWLHVGETRASWFETPQPAFQLFNGMQAV